jgi:MoaA/NifB/PqqE/SkfB family radical SAM enzyme
MCVKETWDPSETEGDMTEETFAALEPVFRNLEALVLNGVGEPLLDSRLEDFIARAKKLMPTESWVGFQTNGMLLDERRGASLVEAGLDRICISVDALNPDTFRKIRRGGEEQGVEKAFAVLQSARISCKNRELLVGLEFVVMRDNIRELPDLLRRAASLGASFAIVTHVLPYAGSSVPLTAFESNMDGAVELFGAWRKKAESEGLDLDEYFKVLWKYMRNPSERDLAVFLAELGAACAQGGIDGVRDILGSSLPSRQITIKAFADTQQQIRNLFGEDEGWREALKTFLTSVEEVGRMGDNSFERAEAIVRDWKEQPVPGTPGLADYLTVIWKYSRTPREQRLYELVEEMKGAARAGGISLHLKNLMERDEEWGAELEQVFLEARRVAEETGLALTLPGTAPSSSRRCDFVENGAAFVSWNGDVHPCYFLWHRYGCHIFGRKKSVTAKSFGNVNERGLTEIWNSPSFRAFREEVLAYDFPYCSNCNVVPCQYLTAEEFEQDCYGNTIPCGDCFWCMGMFRCLQ